jgi:tetratricopeptide (TPR) repeat protein
MLETVREFGLEQLAESGEEAATRDRHATYFGDLVQRLDAVVVVFLPDARRVLDRLEAEHPNLRATLDWLAATGAAVGMLRLAAALDYFWQIRSYVREGQAWLERALALGADAPPGDRAMGLFGLAGQLRAQGEVARGLALCRESLALAREVGELRGIALTAQRASLLARQLGRFDEAVAHDEEAQAALDVLSGEAWAARAASTTLGHVPLGQGDLAEAERQYHDALERQRALGHEPGASHAYGCFP